MHEPLVPMFFPSLGAHISGAEFQYPDNKWLEMCGQMANLVADSGCNKGQLSHLVEAICHDFTEHDEAELKKLVEWQKQGTPWLQIPYYDRSGRLTGVQNRNLIRGALPRFRFPSGSTEPPKARRATLHHRGFLRLLGHALSRSQGHRHPLGHAINEAGYRNALKPPLPAGRGRGWVPHVPRPRRPR